MERLLADAEKLTGVKYDMDNLSDVYEAIHAIQGELGITGTTAKEASSTITGSLSAVKASWQNVLGALALGQNLGPALNSLATTLSTFLFQNLLPMIGNIIAQLPGAIITFITTATPLFIQGGAELINSIITGFNTGLPNFILNIQGFMTNLVTWIQSSLPTLLQSGVDMLVNIGNGIMSQAPNIISTLGTVLDGLLKAILDLLPILLEKGFELVSRLAQGILNNMPAIIGAITNVISRLLATIIEKLPAILQKGIEIVGKIASGIIQNLPAIISAITGILSNLLSTIGAHLPQLLQKGVQLIGQLIAGIISKIPEVLAQAPKIITGLVSGIAGLIGQLVNVGGQLMAGLARGITGAIGNVLGSALEACKGVVSRVKNFFGIASPSKVFTQIGEFLDLGLAEGISENMRPVEKSVSDLTDLVTQDMEGSLSYSLDQGALSRQMNQLSNSSLNPNSAKSIILRTEVKIENFINNRLEDIEEIGERIQELGNEKLLAVGGA